MAKAEYQAHLERRLADLSLGIRKARRRLDESPELQAKVEAAGEVAALEERRERVREKLERLGHEPEGAWEEVKTWVEQELDYLDARLDRWLDRY